jgi:hypothetical protein
MDILNRLDNCNAHAIIADAFQKTSNISIDIEKMEEIMEDYSTMILTWQAAIR